MPIKTGKQYIKNLNKLSPEIWLNGARIKGKISQHPAFRGLIKSQASLYDMQFEERYRDRMTYISPDTGDRVGLSYLPPSSKGDLQRRRNMMSLWADQHHGFLGRAPDYMNTALMAFAGAAGMLAETNPQFADNLRNYYVYCRENDITLSHGFIQSKISMLSAVLDNGNESSAARVHEITQDGYIVSGAFLLNTQGATSEELLIYPQPSMSNDEVNPYAFFFAVPSNLEGIKFVCRENTVNGSSKYNYPLSSRYEEMDTLVILDHVLVPHDRMFLYGDEELSASFFARSHFHTHVSHQILCRYIAKTEFLVGVLEYMAECLDRSGDKFFIDRVSEILITLETLKALVIASEAQSSLDEWGRMLPDPRPLYAANAWYPKVYPQIIETIQLLGSSDLIMIPSEQDFSSPISPYLNKYLQGSDTDAYSKVQLFRLAWELSVSAFGGRQTQYERFFFGSPNTLTERIYSNLGDRDRYMNIVKGWMTHK
ncbi:4-hydroxyphenylacetate 3-hydroxylase N-terminal domain-containing protein [Paenibacillus sp. YPG26]|uniref:4-hydroxyphenylacetate 3-hydroxylase family protein n=1 Tax=Paenibacillus sp. YPG26 TaxID=2878915 RepID=UPI00203C68A6|nr:4-hydroxyphenylacetate 3-hydroxylase N-terminal domain-containing protein [Paenibacillus sp. YPG26]USB32120.1 4-hydroxyphenylacetate 3-monooxygenase, oxygenase component [Paenibacillus sp. YPG26]